MSNKWKYLIIGIILTLISCKKTEYETNETNFKSVQFSDTINIGDELTLDMVIYLSDGCASYSPLSTNIIGDTAFYKAFQKQPKGDDSACPNTIQEYSLTHITSPYNLGGWHYLKFNEGINTIIDSVFVKQ